MEATQSLLEHNRFDSSTNNMEKVHDADDKSKKLSDECELLLKAEDGGGDAHKNLSESLSRGSEVAMEEGT